MTPWRNRPSNLWAKANNRAMRGTRPGALGGLEGDTFELSPPLLSDFLWMAHSIRLGNGISVFLKFLRQSLQTIRMEGDHQLAGTAVKIDPFHQTAHQAS